MLECVLPVYNAFGLQKDSTLKTLFDAEIQNLLESGLIEYHRSQYQFSKKFTENVYLAAKRSTFVEPLSLNDLQGHSICY